MHKVTFNINIDISLYTILIYAFAFERVLAQIATPFSYMDEILCIIIVLRLLFTVNWLYKKELAVIIGLLFLIIVGLIGNIKSGVVNNYFYIAVDVISTIKVWLSYHAIRISRKDDYFFDDLLKNLALFGRALTYIMFMFMALSYFMNTGMLASARFGIRSFMFIFNNPGNFSKLFYFLIPLLAADMTYGKSVYKSISLVLALIVWASTMRSRAFAFILIFILFYALFFIVKREDLKRDVSKIKIWYVMPLLLVAIYVARDQIIFYFTTATQARSVLLRYGLQTLKNYFPIGAGFGTFGSDIAAVHYSKLYSDYGFNAIYGMRSNETYFLNDNFWPMIFGQFGVVGTIVQIYILVVFSKNVLEKTRSNAYLYFSVFVALGFLLLSSVASKSYCEYSSICVFMLLGVFVNTQKNTEEA